MAPYTPQDHAPQTPGASRRWPAIALVVALVVGVGGWVVWQRRGQDTPTATTSPSASSPPAPAKRLPAKIVSPEALLLQPAAVGHPMYWAGEQPGTQLELTTSPETGSTYVRYLPLDVPAGSPDAKYLIVATYPDAEAYSKVQTGAARKGAVSGRAASGALVEMASANSTNAYFAFPGVPLLMEVFDPHPGEAYRIALRGEARLIS